MSVRYRPPGTLHDLDNAEYLERFPLDMAQVSRHALAGFGRRRWKVEFDCEGVPFLWTGGAESEPEAIALGRLAIYMDGRHDQDKARPVACVEVRA